MASMSLSLNAFQSCGVTPAAAASKNAFLSSSSRKECSTESRNTIFSDVAITSVIAARSALIFLAGLAGRIFARLLEGVGGHRLIVELGELPEETTEVGDLFLNDALYEMPGFLPDGVSDALLGLAPLGGDLGTSVPVGRSRARLRTFHGRYALFGTLLSVRRRFTPRLSFEFAHRSFKV